jgi:gliding motility-associated-like protein
MSCIKFILCWLGTFCITQLSFGQQTTMPKQCTNFGNGFSDGGDFDVNPKYSCLSSTVVRVENAKSPNGTNLSGGNYTFNLTDGRDITKRDVFFSKLDTTVTTPGVYWVMQAVNEGGQIYVKCKSFEVIKPEQPDVKKSLCGKNVLTLTFLDTPKNKAHSSYDITWGDGTSDPITDTDLKTKGFPYNITHTYLTSPFSKPQIVAKYIRGASNINYCNSTPYYFEFENNNAPRISELEGLNGGTSNKITMVKGANDKPYSIEQKLKAGNWNPTSKTITRKSGEQFATETITRLNATNEYCFRLKAFDDCTNPIVSNEVCTIIPKVTIVGSNDIKFDWNSPDPAVLKYSIPYSESPNGSNPNSINPVNPTATTFTTKSLDCKKKYNFSINAYIGNTPDQTIIKSPVILVDPKTSPLLPPITVGIVSVENNNLVRFFVPQLDAISRIKYKFYRSEGRDRNFLPVSESADNFYEDQSAEPTKQQYCYKVEYENNCGNNSEQSPAFCSVFLTSTQANTLNWIPPVIQSNNTNPIEYYIESIDQNNLKQNINITTNTSQNVKQQIENLLNLTNTIGEAKFVIKARQIINVFINNQIIPIPSEVSSNEYNFIIPPQIFVPTSFSPNEDGINDIFAAKGRYFVQFNLEIYDRWGNVIFESQDLNTGWNGTANDGVTPASIGNYGFKIYGLDTAGNKFEKIGSVKLVK